MYCFHSNRIRYRVAGLFVVDKPMHFYFFPALFLLLAMIVGSCGIPPTQNRYQQARVETQTNTGAVAELQQKAIRALEQQNTRLSIDYLERAIKIEPRNAMSWHYLAKSYFQQQDFGKCLAMIERSMSYGYRSDDFFHANEVLKKKCLES